MITENQIQMLPKDRLILDLCAGTGSWSAPYADAGYKVKRVDIKTGEDVRLFLKLDEPVYGIMAAPVCTVFAASGARRPHRVKYYSIEN